MNEAQIDIEPTKPQYPPCIGCGYCCIKAQCPVSQYRYGLVDICPALKWNGKRHVCELMEKDDAQGVYAKLVLHEGAGCSSSLNSWRREPLRNRIIK